MIINKVVGAFSMLLWWYQKLKSCLSSFPGIDKVDFLIFSSAVLIALVTLGLILLFLFHSTLVLNSNFLFYFWSWWPLKDLELWKFHWWKNTWYHILESLWLINLYLLMAAKFINLYIMIFFNCSTINFYGNFTVIYDRQKSLLEKDNRTGLPICRSSYSNCCRLY